MPTTFNLSYEFPHLPTQAQIVDIQYACNQWAAVLVNNNLDINVHVWAVDMAPTGLNGMCVPGIVQGGGMTRTRPQAKLIGNIAHNDPGIDLVVILDTGTGWILRPNIPNAGEYSLATTMMHELCHGLGFIGLCGVNAVNDGIYTDAASLIIAVQHTMNSMVPNVALPIGFFPPAPVSGIAAITPFANLFNYTNAHLHKGTPANDYTAFTTPNDIELTAAQIPAPFIVATGNPFQPFTTCDHIVGGAYLMNESTVGQNYNAPDISSKQVLSAMGWVVV